ncbi:MAG: hypothetical protein V2A79_00215 [Planctomycetota bacterium]
MPIDFLCRPGSAFRRRHLVDVPGDGSFPFRSWCRLQQSLYRQRMGWKCGKGGGDGRDIGNYLTAPDADAGRNFLTPEIFAAARERLANRELGDSIDSDRLLRNLLTSQTLCFNLFIPQMLDLRLATLIWRTPLPHCVAEVIDVKLEHSPGRGDEVRHTGDRSAFDAFIEYVHVDGYRGIIGIETKYTDTFSPPGGDPKPRQKELAASTGLYMPDGWRRLQKMPTQQLWRTHLLAETMRDDQHRHVTYTVLHAAGDVECTGVLPEYEAALTPQAVAEGRLLQMTLEDFVAKARPVLSSADGAWLDGFHARYLDWSAVEAEIGPA